MIRVAMFDLGLTLIDAGNRPFPHVKEALAAIGSFKTADDTPLASCLVSDFTMPVPPATSAKVNAIFKEYIAILDETGLRSFFEPVKKRVTLSTHAGVQKPQRKIFETALQRLASSATLADSLFVTESSAHIRAARDTLGMHTLQFRPPSGTPGFDDWAQAPGIIAALVAPHHVANAEAALRAHLAAKHGLELSSAEPSVRGKTKFAAKAWHPVSVPGFDDLHEVHVSIPVEGEATRGPEGEVRSVKINEPSAEDIDEVTSYVRSLATHGQIEGHASAGSRTATHRIETDANGKRKLVRRGFSAI